MITATTTCSVKTAQTAPALPNTSRTSFIIGFIGALLATGTLFAGPTYADPPALHVITQSA